MSAIKGKLCQLVLLLSIIIHKCAQQSCNPPFTAVSNYQGSYCVKCDSTCQTCFDDSVSGCVTCISDFNLNQNTSFCIPPDTALIHTVESSYKYYKFTQYGNWTGGTPYDCQFTTILMPSTPGGSIQVNNYLGKHYGLRVVVSAWWIAGASNSTILLQVITPTGGNLYSNDTIIFSNSQSTANGSNYCSGSYASNFDTGIFNGSSTTYVTVRFSSTSTNWGIREYVFIQYLCNTTYCKTCTGNQWNNCLSCTDSRRKVYSGECRCDPRKLGTKGYFKHPDMDYCVFPCPSRPSVGQYYGDVGTQECVLQCYSNTTATYGVMFADDSTGQCVAQCPQNISLGTQGVKNVYHDVANRRCVTNCPSTAPYKFDGNRTCLASCPTINSTVYYKLDMNMSCVTACPSNQQIRLFRDSYLGKCVDDCEGTDWWADSLTGSCTAICSGTQYFQDNTTTRNRCVRVCPEPLYFGDLFTGKCIDHCYGGKFGDTLSGSLRHCVVTCSGGYYGLLTGNRACVPICPNGTWGQDTHHTCVLATTDCDSNRYADNYTHKCVRKGTCSFGQYSTDVGTKCTMICPNGTYADDGQKHCLTSCSGLYFADPGIPKCVKMCQTPNLYADTGSNNMCVSQCNQSEPTKYRQFSKKQCVSVCPDDPYTFSDPDAEACVYNCSVGRYKDDLSDPSDKRCVENCTDPNWGDNSTGYGQCVRRCPENPPLFGDTVAGFRVCVEVCQQNTFGDQSPNGYRQCMPTCPDGYFAQNDDLRRCVLRCNSTTFGTNKICKFPEDCPAGEVGDPSTNLCTSWCPQSEGTFADDIVSYLCVQRCPVNNSILYFADPTDRWCRDTCTAANKLFGNNDTQTCETECIDFESYADHIHPNRFCIANCTDENITNGTNTTSDDVLILYYRNNYTKTCVTSMGCPLNYFADNITKDCVSDCPINESNQTWGHRPTKTCVQMCYGSLWGDDSTGIALCVPLCPSLPPKWSYDPEMICVTECPASDLLWGEDYNRTCVEICPMHPTIPLKYTYAFNITRRCLQDCPEGYFSDKTARMCWDDPANCSYGWGDDYNNSCTTLCTGPQPWNSFGDNLTHLCTIRCSVDSYADNYTSTRICVQVCPGSYNADGVPDPGSFDSFGDNSTQSCVLHCVSPQTWADWQTHRCQSRCTGDDNTTVPTYSENVRGRCVIALWCPKTPDKLFGDNNTRSCVTTCFFDQNVTEWADNITRTCIPQCLNYSIPNFNTTTPWDGIDTRYYGDLSTNSPICVIQCPRVPRLFGQNSTNKCVEECPDNQYGDQTGNRSCVSFCPIINGVIWFTQITQHICVTLCEEGTWGNVHGQPHCETVPTDCIEGEYADNSTNLCVPLCPEDQNYFGDPSTRLCVDRCPFLNDTVYNSTANISMPEGYLYADYSTRLCVYRCPDDFGPYGTFGDNETNTCVYRCPTGSYGDWQTTNRHCVEVCTAGTYADDLTMTCVSECPASPPYFGQSLNWTCVRNCPNGTWASAQTRTCVEECPTGQYRLSDQRTQCVDVCPSSPDLYSDPESNNCVLACQQGNSTPFADPTDRMCKDSCSPLFQYNYRCVKYCPHGYYANSTNNCVRASECDAGLFADNATTKCISPCVAGAFADPNSKYCIAICPDGWYGDIDECVQNCTTPNTSSSVITQVCMSICPNYTYSENETCKETCQYGYANDLLRICAPGCPLGLFADPLTHDCVADCYDNQTNDTYDWFRNTNTGFCVIDCGLQFKDFITGNCVDKCSNGYWGNKHNMSCIPRCLSGEYGYEGANQRTCYLPTLLPGYATSLFGDPVSAQYVAVCPITPILYFGDSVLHECVQVCHNHSTTDYYGDPSTRKCQSICQSPIFYTADPATQRCELRCTEGTFRFNTTPICVNVCPVGFADETTNVCVDVCPYWADTFGYHNLTSNERVCVMECPVNYYAEPVRRTCSLTCDSPYFAYNDTHQCVTHCIDSYADRSNRRCVLGCFSNSYPNADNSTNRCVFRCPSNPDYYADDHVCVYYCSNPRDFADPDSRSCVARCPNTTSGYTYGDPTTRRCVYTCPLYYFADQTTNKCVRVCPARYYGYNGTRECLLSCPSNQSLFADPFTHMCAYTCSEGYFGSNITQQCVRTCDLDYWGNPLNTLCVQVCPSTIYTYGQNDTRTCVKTCMNHSGFADNMTRICRDVCQNTSNWLTFADPTTKSCVQMCPDTYYMENSTNECRQRCLTGYADNYSRFCVLQCPDDPESYGDTTYDVCVYSCLRGEFSDNSTNLCVQQCPSTPDYYGDPNNDHRCVLFCSEGLWAQNSSRRCVPTCNSNQFADNLTRRCVRHCPASQSTYGDTVNHKCVRVCPINYWADNSTQTCVTNCPDITLGGVLVDTYSDNLTHYCVLTCPEPNFGRIDTNKCVAQCPSVPNLFGHPEGRICVDVTNCFAVGGVQYFADDTTRTCVQKCPLNRWADKNLSKCVQTCPTHYFRNNNNQECVSNCPEDPDEYASTTSLNCTRKCPNNYYAVVNSTGYRICVQDCAPYGLIKNNITNKCVALNECSTDPFMFGDYNSGACVFYCSNLYFADNRTQTCVYTCPSAWELFGSLATYECVELCQNFKFADQLFSARPRTCRSTCSSGYFADNQTSRCMQRCSQIKPFYYEDIPSGSCVEICPDQSYAYNPNQTCIYSNLTLGGYISNCPDDYFADRISKSCVKLCPIGSFATASNKYCQPTCSGLEFADTQTRTCTTVCSLHTFSLNANASAQVCVQFCPPPYYAQNSSKSCVLNCSSLLALNTTRSCQTYCPDPYLAQWSINKCVLSCSPKFADFETRTCITPCVAPSYSNSQTFTCDLICPENYFGRNTTRECQTTCLNGSYADPHSRICVAQCPVNPTLFADDRSNQCVSYCESPLFAYIVDRTCVEFCPNVSNDVYLADSSNRKCVISCVNEVISYADYSNNQCTDFCPNGTFASNYTKQCVPVCPNDPNDTFSDNVTHICMDVCHVGFGYSGTLNCVAQCWWPLFADPTTRLCVEYCPDGYFAQNETATCRQTCQPGSYADPTTHRCVLDCPDSQDLFKFQNWTCLAQCPSGYYANRNISSCVQICDSTNGMYAYPEDNTCVMECPFPYRGFDPNHTCILSCPSIYFYNKTRNVCTRCPMECTTCTGPTSCMTCVAGKNLFNGQCSASCQPSGGSITYAHPTTNMCVAICPPTYYGDNSTYTCTTLCPNKQYGSTVTGLCEHCPRTCALCLNTSYCTSCEFNATMAIDRMCYSHCNSTHQYYYNSLCYSVCPIGTYVTYTGVHCAACSNLCRTCSGTASNCTTCFDRYFYNYSCLTQCPSGFYGATDLTCVACSSSSAQVCSQPLSFSTTVSIQNYQYVVSVKFNQEVSIQKQIDQILKVEMKVSRRLLDVADLINNGVSYTYKILSDGTIKLYLNLNTDLNSPQFTVRFTDPTAVTSLVNGASLQDVTTDFAIEKVEYYPPEDGKDIGIKKVTMFTVIFILLLYCVTVLFTDAMVKPIQMLQIMFFHGVATAPMSASMYFYLLELKLSLLQFLPNWLSIPLSKDITLHSTSTQKTIDIFVDYNFFRNVGQIVFMIVIAFGLWALFMILSNRRIVEHKTWHNFLELVSVRRFRFSLLNDIISVFYVPILWFGFNQFQELFSAGYLGFNGFICLFMVVFSIIYPIGLIYVWWKKEGVEVEERFPFMANRLNKNKERAPLEIPATYLYLLFSVIWLVGLDKKSTAQMALLFVTNFVYSTYLIVSRPYSVHVNTIMGMVWSLILMTIQMFLIYFSVHNSSILSSEKTRLTNPLLIVISVFMMILIIWSVWRSVWQFIDIWQFFKQTQFYKHYGDPDVEVKSQVSQVYNKYQKVAINVEPAVGDVVIDKMYKECNEKGENVIKVRKKVLKKKPKVKGRGKQNEGKIQQQQHEFVRINNVNPFDYDYDQDFKPKVNKEPMKRAFDDDLRDISSEDQGKPQKKETKLDNQGKATRKIEVDKEDKRIKSIQDIGSLYQISVEQNEESEEKKYVENEEQDDSGNLRYLEVASEESKQQQKENQNELKIDSIKDESQNFDYNVEESQDVLAPPKQPVDDEYSQVERNKQIANVVREEAEKKQEEEQYGQFSIGNEILEEAEEPKKEQQKQRRREQNAMDIWEGLDTPQLSHEQSKGKQQRMEEKKIESKPKGIEELLEEEQGNKKKKLLFLFDELEDD